MKDYGVNLICVEDGIDNSKEAGKLLISIIAAVAEMGGKISECRQWLGEKITRLDITILVRIP